jgi:hypothetical protein
MGWRTVVLPLFAGACAATPPASTAEAPARSAPEVPSVTADELTRVEALTLGDLTLTQNGAPGLVLARDGTVSLPDQRVLGKLGSDGRFLDPRGALLAELTADGEIITGRGEYLPVTIDRAGTIRLLKENRSIRLNADGTLEGANPGAPVVTVKGLTPATSRAALFLLVLSAYPVRPGS